MPADLALVILAAGKGTRMKSGRAKVLHEAGGLPLIDHALRAAGPVTHRGRAGVWVVVGHQADAVRRLAELHGARAVLQKPQLGTGHAVAQALRALPRRLPRVLVLPGDAPLVRAETLQALVRQHDQTRAAATILTAELQAPRGYGRIRRNAVGAVEEIVEEGKLRPDEAGIHEVNSGVYCFERAALAAVLGRLGRDNLHREYYLTDTIKLLREAGHNLFTYTTDDPEEILGVNSRAQLARVDTALCRRKAVALMDSGVTIFQPDTVVIDADVSVGADTLIERGVELRGRTRVGRRCRLGAFSILRNAALADDVTLNPHSVVLNSRLGPGVTVGPFAHLRDGADIRKGARIGNYVEVKKSVVGEGTKALHLTYLGDTTIGRDTNIGAGTITCNYDGVNKNPTAIGDRVFVGSGTELVAPVRVASGAYIAAGSTVTENVPRGALAIARSRQVNKTGWAWTRRQKLAAAKARKEEPAVAVRLANATNGKKARPPRSRRRTRPRRKAARRR